MIAREESRDGIQYYLRYYEDWGDFIDRAEEVIELAPGKQKDGLGCASMKDDANWSGSKSLQEAVRLGRFGWEEGRDKILEIRKRLKIDSVLPNAKRIDRIMDVSGDEPDVALYLMGEPDNMATLVDSNSTDGRVVRILVNRTASWHIDADDLLRRGVSILIAIETMIRLGYSIELSICDAVSAGYGSDGSRMEDYIPVLRAGDPVNLDTIAFMLAHPSVLRRLLFATQEMEAVKVRKTFGFHGSGGYGHCAEPEKVTEKDLMIKKDDGAVNSEDKIIPYAVELLSKIGIKVDD
jgi:hypothetical protein